MDVVLSVQSVKYPLTGIGRYTYELAHHLPHLPLVEAVRLYNGERFLDHLPDAQSLSSQAAERAATGPVQRLKRVLARNQMVVDLYRFLKSRSETSPFAGLENHIYHGTNFYVPRFPGVSVMTIHDLSVFTMPHFHPRERVFYLSREVEESMKRVSRIVTDSDYIKAEIVSHFGYAPDRISVAKLACGAEFRPRTAQETAATLSLYDLVHGGYAFYAGTIEPRKNLANLIEAYAALPLAVRLRRPLVLSGYKGWNNEDILERIARGQREGWIRYLGFVSNDHLPELLAGAALFVFPSWYEGFGLPVLEAMASGVPVMTSPASCLPEVGGEAVLYAAPDDIGAMTRGIEQGLFDEAWRQDAQRDGLARAAQFSWQRCAEETASAYRLALDGRL